MVPLRIVRDDLGWENAACPPMAEPGPVLRGFLDRLRWVALGCRAAARVDLFEACAVLSSDRHVADTAHAEVLVKGMSQAIGKPAVFYRPGVAEISFDEAWILRIVAAMDGGDDASLLFLLRSRVHPAACRNLGFLLRNARDRLAV